MKSLTLPIVFGLLAIMCHATPSSVQHKARQATVLSLTFYGAGENPSSYEVDVPLEQEENFQNFNISESLPSPTRRAVSFLIPGFYTCVSREPWYHHPDLCCSQPSERLSYLSWWSWILRYHWNRWQPDDCTGRL